MPSLAIKIIYGLICLWMILLSVYVIRNDFAKESMEVFYPVLGAISLSTLLAIKTIYVDRPKTQEKNFSIAVLHNLSWGHLLAPYRFLQGDTPSESLPDFAIGMTHIDGLADYVYFKDVPIAKELSEPLQIARPETGVLDHRTLPYEIIEFLILEKLEARSRPSWLNDEPVTISLLGLMGKKVPKAGTGVAATIDVDASSFPQNRLFLAHPLKINLPSRASILVSGSPGNRKVEIDTKYSRSIISIEGGQFGQFEPMHDWITRDMVSQWNIPNNSALAHHSFRLDWKFTLLPFARFAEEAKLHEEWFSTAFEYLREEFSWDVARSRLQQRRNFLGPTAVIKAD